MFCHASGENVVGESNERVHKKLIINSPLNIVLLIIRNKSVS